MDNKILFNTSRIILLITIILMSINFFFYSFNDWTVRITEIIMVIDMAIVVYSTIKRKL